MDNLLHISHFGHLRCDLSVVVSVKIFTIDYETYFDDEYTLKKLTTEEYIRDPRFEAHGAAICDGETSTWLTTRELKEQFEIWSTQHTQVCLIAHHAHFDGLITSHHFSYCPAQWVCTLSMGRVVFDSGLKLGLGDLAERFGLSPKTVPYQEMKGKRWGQMSSTLQKSIAGSACHDASLTHTIAGYMLAGHPIVPYLFPVSELPVVSLTVKMFTEPCLIGDLDLLGQAWSAEEKAKQDLFVRLSDVLQCSLVTPERLRKDVEFAAMLEVLGIEPEWKTTAKGNDKYAFAKSDFFMQDLVTSDDPDVALLAEARLKAQSSIYQTRAERLGFMATRGPMCVYLAYAAAHTRRWGGGDKANWQNFPRSDPAKPRKGALRRAIKAP